MKKNNKEEKKQRFSLTLILSLFVLVLITFVGAVSIAILYLMVRLNIIDAADWHPGLSSLIWSMPLISAIIGFGITMLISKITLKPVNLLINQLNRLASGNFKSRIHFGKPISKLNAFKEIEASFNIAARELEHTEMLRNDFINNFSHEFKTPIVSIAGFAKLLQHGNLSEEQKKEYLAIIEEESLRLSYMTSSFLSLTKVENQMILTNVSTYNLSEQLRSAVLLLADKWTSKNLNLDMEFEEHMIAANQELLKQVWINLLDNAIKFSEKGGTVSITITENSDGISVAITNYGPEIPSESLDRIFNKFYQADESHSSEGNGIGLAVVKKVTELHKGAVFVNCENGLTSFTVRLPLKQLSDK